MNKIQFSITINAPAEKVYNMMIGSETYKIWASEFNPTSDFEGSWNKGSKIYFTGEHEGKKGGMIAEIIENIPNEFISVHHYGFLDGEIEITDAAMLEEWGDALENYSFAEVNGITTVNIQTVSTNEYLDYFNKTWPLALNKLKEICEK